MSPEFACDREKLIFLSHNTDRNSVPNDSTTQNDKRLFITLLHITKDVVGPIFRANALLSTGNCTSALLASKNFEITSKNFEITCMFLQPTRLGLQRQSFCPRRQAESRVFLWVSTPKVGGFAYILALFDQAQNLTTNRTDSQERMQKKEE